MIDLLLTNIVYVSYRLFISGPIVKFLNSRWPFYLAVFIMAQLSFAFDVFVFGYYFDATALPDVYNYCISDIFYTTRVLAAWWLIKFLWMKLKNYWLAVFCGAEITFICDYFIIKNMFF